MKPIEESLREFADHVAAFVDELPDGEYKGLGRLRLMLREIPALLAAQAPADTPPPSKSQIKHMVERFLMWKLPENFNPDCGISFKKSYNENTPYPAKHEPVGTNLFDATQAEAMVRYMVEGMPSGADAVAAERERCAKVMCQLCEENIPMADEKRHKGGGYCYAWAIRATPASEPAPEPPVTGVVNTYLLANLVKELRESNGYIEDGIADQIEEIMRTAGPATNPDVILYKRADQPACECEVVHNIECPVGVELRKKRSDENTIR